MLAIAMIGFLGTFAAAQTDPAPSPAIVETPEPASPSTITLSISGFGAAESAWVKAYHEGFVSRLDGWIESTGLSRFHGRLECAYRDGVLYLILVQTNFDPNKTPTVASGYPSPYLVYYPRHAMSAHLLLHQWALGMYGKEGLPLSVWAVVNESVRYAGFERQDRPGVTMLIGQYMSSGRPTPTAPVIIQDVRGNHPIYPLASRGSYWGMPPMFGPDGRETDAAVLWKFMDWEKVAPTRSGRPEGDAPR